MPSTKVSRRALHRLTTMPQKARGCGQHIAASLLRCAWACLKILSWSTAAVDRDSTNWRTAVRLCTNTRAVWMRVSSIERIEPRQLSSKRLGWAPHVHWLGEACADGGSCTRVRSIKRHEFQRLFFLTIVRRLGSKGFAIPLRSYIDNSHIE